MKIRGYLKFMVIFILIIGLYFLMVMNIDYFIKDYDNELLSYENKYDLKNSDNNVIANVLTGSVEIATMSDLDKIFSNSFAINFLSKLYRVDDNEIKEEFTKLVNLKMVNLVTSKYYGEKFIYFNGVEINGISNLLVLSLDCKKIYYLKYLDGDVCSLNIETNYNIEKATERLYSLLNSYGIIKNFSFAITSIRSDYLKEFNYDSNQIYFVEDYEHLIELEYNATCNELYELKIGF